MWLSTRVAVQPLIPRIIDKFLDLLQVVMHSEWSRNVS
jgi:hypothetical protein